jgi:hypothetical protein
MICVWSPFKITNLREKDLVFGKDINLSYDNGNVIKLISKADLFKDIKQPTGVYGLYFFTVVFEARH